MNKTKSQFGCLDTKNRDDIKIMEQMLKDKKDSKKAPDKHSNINLKIASA